MADGSNWRHFGGNEVKCKVGDEYLPVCFDVTNVPHPMLSVNSVNEASARVEFPPVGSLDHAGFENWANTASAEENVQAVLQACSGGSDDGGQHRRCILNRSWLNKLTSQCNSPPDQRLLRWRPRTSFARHKEMHTQLYVVLVQRRGKTASRNEDTRIDADGIQKLKGRQKDRLTRFGKTHADEKVHFGMNVSDHVNRRTVSIRCGLQGGGGKCAAVCLKGHVASLGVRKFTCHRSRG